MTPTQANSVADMKSYHEEVEEVEEEKKADGEK